jgi:hypothetical protein
MTVRLLKRELLRQGVGSSSSSTDGSGSSSSSDCRPGDMRIFLHRIEMQVRALGNAGAS